MLLYNRIKRSAPRNDLCVTDFSERVNEMKATKHIKTLNKANLKESAAKGGCGECQASCQSACRTSCTVANQKCEK